MRTPQRSYGAFLLTLCVLGATLSACQTTDPQLGHLLGADPDAPKLPDATLSVNIDWASSKLQLTTKERLTAPIFPYVLIYTEDNKLIVEKGGELSSPEQGAEIIFPKGSVCLFISSYDIKVPKTEFLPSIEVEKQRADCELLKPTIIRAKDEPPIDRAHLTTEGLSSPYLLNFFPAPP